MNEIKFVFIYLSLYKCFNGRLSGFQVRMFMLVTATINIRKAEKATGFNLCNFLSYCHRSFI